MADIIQIRRGTAALWQLRNPILAQGEQGYETDTLKEKLGDGVTAWNDLQYKTLSSADPLNLGYYPTEAALTTAHPTGIEGNYAIVGATDTVWIWDIDTSDWVDSGNALGAVPINSIGLLELKQEILNALFPQRVDMGTSDILNWADPNATFVKNQTANSTFTFSNLPTGTKTKTITLHLNPGTYSGSFPAYCTKIGANVIEPSVANILVFECVNGNSGSELVYYTVNPNV